METFSALLAISAGNSPVPGELPTERPVTRSFDVFFDLRLNKRLSKQSWCWWLETLSRPLWRHRNVSTVCASGTSTGELWWSLWWVPSLWECPSCVTVKQHFAIAPTYIEYLLCLFIIYDCIILKKKACLYTQVVIFFQYSLRSY